MPRLIALRLNLKLRGDKLLFTYIRRLLSDAAQEAKAGGNAPKGKSFFEVDAETEITSESLLTSVRLVPQIPIRDRGDDVSSWIGGHPRFPEEVPWPTVRNVENPSEVPAAFLAQVSCSHLPAALWDGIGPRSGWLLFFVHPNWPPAPCVLHIEQLGPERTGPLHIETDWYLPLCREKLATQSGPNHPPRWPLDLIAQRSDERERLAIDRFRASDHYLSDEHDFDADMFARSPKNLPEDRRPLNLHAEDANALGSDVDTRHLALWEYITAYQFGGMGHYPFRYCHDDVDPDGEKVALLELHSMYLMGWNWADLDNLIFIIDPKDLQTGAFERVDFTITN